VPFLRLPARGKHVKPSVAPKIAVAGGLAAAALLADGGSASASAPNSDWDRLAGCESGGNWSINTGNGFYGGLQFDLGTWHGAGGSGRPDQASRSEQIRVANVVHSARGFAPWPACSRRLGLGRGSAPKQDTAPVVTAPAAAPATFSGSRDAQRASRSRRTALAAGPQLPRLAVATPPSFSGHVLTTADASAVRPDVARWQRRMAARGWDVAVDGRFGPQSSDVAARFAAEKHLAPAQAGTVDKAVWDAAWALAVS
jgi:hypothetical protein